MGTVTVVQKAIWWVSNGNNMENTYLQCIKKEVMMKETLLQTGQFSLELRNGYDAAKITTGKEIGKFCVMRKTFRTGDD